jgi:hypothetical protein
LPSDCNWFPSRVSCIHSARPVVERGGVASVSVHSIDRSITCHQRQANTRQSCTSVHVQQVPSTKPTHTNTHTHIRHALTVLSLVSDARDPSPAAVSLLLWSWSTLRFVSLWLRSEGNASSAFECKSSVRNLSSAVTPAGILFNPDSDRFNTPVLAAVATLVATAFWRPLERVSMPCAAGFDGPQPIFLRTRVPGLTNQDYFNKFASARANECSLAGFVGLVCLLCCARPPRMSERCSSRTSSSSLSISRSRSWIDRVRPKQVRARTSM